MQVAMNCWFNDYEDMAVLNAGIGCEHLLKAYLANHHPLLISDNRDQALRFYAIGRGDAAPVPLSHAKTISAEQAFRHVEALLSSGTGVTFKQFETILIERNSVAHAAYCDKDKAAETLTFAIAVADAIRTELGISEEDFWGSYVGNMNDLVQRREAVRSLRAYQAAEAAKRREQFANADTRPKISPASIYSASDHVSATPAELVAITKIIYAKKIYGARWGKKKPSALKEADIFRKGDIFDFDGWEKSYPGLAASGEPQDCPACGYLRAETYGYVAGEPCGCETPEKGTCAHLNGLMIWARNTHFHCQACSLESHDRDEMAALGINIEKIEILISRPPIEFEGHEKRSL
jgi:hypothetical protein